MIGNKGIHKTFAANGWTKDLCERCYLTDKDERGSVETTFATSITMMEKLNCDNIGVRVASLAELMEAIFPRKDMPKLEHSTSDLVAVYLSFASSLPADMLPGINEYLIKKSGGNAKEVQRLTTEIHTEFSRLDFKQMSSMAPIRACLDGGFEGDVASLFTS